MALAGQPDCAGEQIDLREAENHNQCHRSLSGAYRRPISLRHIGLYLC